MPQGENDTPPQSPGIPNLSDDHLYDDEVDEEIDLPEGMADGDVDTLDDEEEEELEELPGGLDQLEEMLNRVEDNSDIKFKQHTKAVFCCSFHPVAGTDLVASGGEDDLAYIWNSKTGEMEKKLDADWKDSVHCVAWSADGHYLAAADMSGVIKVFRYPGYAQVWSFELGDIEWMRWHRQASVLFCGTADSEMWMWKIPSGDSKVFQGTGEKTECGTIFPLGTKAACGYADGSIRIFDLKSGSLLHNIQPQGNGHLDSINYITCHPNNNLIATASMDGTAKLWNSNTAKLIGTLLVGPKQEENSASSVECCEFPSDKTASICVTGSLDGVVTIWDTNTQLSRSSVKVGDGVTCLVIHQTAPIILVGTLEGVVRSLNLLSGDSLAEFGGHTGNILDISLSPCGSRFATASDDGYCRVYTDRELEQAEN